MKLSLRKGRVSTYAFQSQESEVRTTAKIEERTIMHTEVREW